MWVESGRWFSKVEEVEVEVESFSSASTSASFFSRSSLSRPLGLLFPLLTASTTVTVATAASATRREKARMAVGISCARDVCLKSLFFSMGKERRNMISISHSCHRRKNHALPAPRLRRPRRRLAPHEAEDERRESPSPPVLHRKQQQQRQRRPSVEVPATRLDRCLFVVFVVDLDLLD